MLKFSVAPKRVAEAFIFACEAELQAPKPGNVHIFASGHGMATQDFVDSAHVAAPFIADPNLTVGAKILAATKATWAAVGQNTNLGIILLCAPLAQAALNAATADLRLETSQLCKALGLDDARDAFQAIQLASPAGLGASTTDDVRAPAQTTLASAMAQAAPRDRIAYQYAHDYCDIFDIGLKSLDRAREAGEDEILSTLTVYLAFLGSFQDSHIARKYGPHRAQSVLLEARSFIAQFSGAARSQRIAAALKWDAELKQKRLNPGTSADLTVATLFADKLGQSLANVPKNG